MTGKTHMICSTAAMAVFALGHKEGIQVCGADVQPLICIIPTAVGAFLPDMDIQQSRLGQKFKILSKNMKHRGITHTLLAPVCLLVGTACIQTRGAAIIASLLIGLLVGLLFDKKGGTSRGKWYKRLITWCTNKRGILATVLMLILTYFLPSTGASLIFGIFVGWTLHIFEDLFNSKGCPILWPLAKGHVHIPVIGVIKTRHWTEYVFLLAWLGGCGVWAFLTLVG